MFWKRNCKIKHWKKTLKWRQKIFSAKIRDKTFFEKQKKNEWKKIEMKNDIFSGSKEQNVFCCEQEKLLEKKFWNKDQTAVKTKWAVLWNNSLPEIWSTAAIPHRLQKEYILTRSL